jgi:hypothetical protein
MKCQLTLVLVFCFLLQKHVFDETLPNFIKTKHLVEGENKEQKRVKAW